MDSQASKILREAMREPVEMIELVSSGYLLDGTPKPVAKVGCHDGTPIIISLNQYCVTLTCASEGVCVNRRPKDFDLNTLFCEHLPVFYDDEFAVRVPLYPFLRGPSHPVFDAEDWFIDAITLITCKSNKIQNYPAAIVVSFHHTFQFGLSAACESHFRFFYNEHCDRLVAEAKQSNMHSLTTLRRENAAARPTESVLWLAE